MKFDLNIKDRILVRLYVSNMQTKSRRETNVVLREPEIAQAFLKMTKR